MIIKTKNGDITASGFVARNAEFSKKGDKETPFTKFSIATVKNENGETVWLNCDCWRDVALYAAEIEKGDNIHIDGKIRNFEKNDGSIGEICTVDFVLIMPKQQERQASKPVDVAVTVEDTDDSLPF